MPMPTKSFAFRLIGQTTLFRSVRIYRAAGFIPTVHGVTLDGKRQTHARLVDVVRLDGRPAARWRRWK